MVAHANQFRFNPAVKGPVGIAIKIQVPAKSVTAEATSAAAWGGVAPPQLTFFVSVIHNTNLILSERRGKYKV